MTLDRRNQASYDTAVYDELKAAMQYLVKTYGLTLSKRELKVAIFYATANCSESATLRHFPTLTPESLNKILDRVRTEFTKHNIRLSK